MLARAHLQQLLLTLITSWAFLCPFENRSCKLVLGEEVADQKPQQHLEHDQEHEELGNPLVATIHDPKKDIQVENGGKVCISWIDVGELEIHEKCSDVIHDATQLVSINLGRVRNVQAQQSITYIVEGINEHGKPVSISSISGHNGLARKKNQVQRCQIRITSPQSGQVYSGIQDLHLFYEIKYCTLPENGRLFFLSHKRESVPVEMVHGFECSSSDKICHGVITMSEIQPGTHSTSALLQTEEDGQFIPWSKDSEWTVTFDVLPTKLEARSEVALDPSKESLEEEDFVTQRIRDQIKKSKKPLNVLYVGTLQYDGQKVIWANQMNGIRELGSEQQMSYVTFAEKTNEEPFLQTLRKNRVFFNREPLQLEQVDDTETLNIEALMHNIIDTLDWFGKTNLVKCSKIQSECSRQRSEIIFFFIPKTARRMIQKMVGNFEGYDSLVFANSKSLADVLLVRVARFAGVKKVIMDLPNLGPNPATNADVVVAPSYDTAQESSVAQQNGEKTVIHPGIDHANYEYKAKTYRDDKTLRTIKIGFVARLEPEKSPGLFIHLCASLISQCQKEESNFSYKFIIVGGGKLSSSLKRLAKLKNVEIDFKGFVNPSKIGPTLSDIDILINPSLVRGETFCITNIEAMFMGTPIVSFGAGGVSDYLQSSFNGWRVKSPTIESLLESTQEAIDMLVYDIASFLAISQNAHSTAAQYSTRKMTNKYIDLYLR